MQNALYFPYIHIRTEKLLKSALLLWDQLEYVVPYPKYPISYVGIGYNRKDAKILEEAHSLVCRERVPTAEERVAANERVLDLVTTPNLPSWFLKLPPDKRGFAIHFEKLFDNTWTQLKQLGMEIYDRDDKDVYVPTVFGQASMAILVESCSGNDSELVTDSPLATTTLRTASEIEERKAKGMDLDSNKSYFTAVEALNFIKVDRFTLRKLIDFRQRELREQTPYQAQFRKKYWEELDKSVVEYRKAKNKAEEERVRRRFYEAMENDFKFLKAEIGLSTAEVLFEADTAKLVSVGAAVLAGGTVGIVTSLVEGVRYVAAKATGMAAKKRATQLKHASSYLYLFKNEVNKGRPLGSRGGNAVH